MKPVAAVEIDGRQVAVTRPGKVLFPQDRITKADLIDYYQRVSPLMLPYLEDRPLVLQRFPDGIGKPGFIQKAVAAFYPSWIRRVTVKKAAGVVEHVVCDTAATLAYLANQACITMHPWLSRVDNLNCPDQMILDFDPSRDDDLAAVVGGALAMKELLDGLKLPAFVRATGSRGLHVVVPLDGKQSFEEVRAFARQLALIVVDRDSGRYTLEAHKDKRSGRVLIDINRNGYAQTAVGNYAVRARPGAPVAVPLEWAELRAKKFRPDMYTIRNVFARVEKIEDPWKGFRRHAASLKSAALNLESLHAA
jgi:bifunctional non-homologous end joining protein LigD